MLKSVEVILSGTLQKVDVSADAKEGETSNAAVDDNWGASAVMDNWQTSDTRADDKFNFPAIPQYEVVFAPSGASLQCLGRKENSETWS